MFTSLLIGVICGVGHHCLYKRFDNSIVGSTHEEQWNIRSAFASACQAAIQLTVQSRVGSGFALVVKLSLTGSVWFAYTQWLWRTLKRKAISLRGLDAAFSVQTSVLALRDLDEILKLRVGAVLALIAWYASVASNSLALIAMQMPSDSVLDNVRNPVCHPQLQRLAR